MKINNFSFKLLSLTLNIKIRAGLNVVDFDCVFAHVLEHWLLDGQLMDGHLLVFILKNLNLVLFALEDFLSLEEPFGLLVSLAEGGGEDNLLLLELLDALVLQWNDPFIRFLKMKMLLLFL